MKALSFFWLLAGLFCLNLSGQGTGNSPVMEYIQMDTVLVTSEPEVNQYRPSRKISSVINHLKLEITPLIKERKILGKAEINLQPQYYPVNSVNLDARGMLIHQVYLLHKGENIPLQFEYNNVVLKVFLGRYFSKNQPYTLRIEYTAAPYELEQKGVIPSSGRGVYFIDPLDYNPHKPLQVWTQNQAESASCWFPVIDAPNIRYTQEMYITVPQNMVTLSNGLLLSSQKNNNGSKTDYWKQNQTHPSYLTMFAVGEFEVVKDNWGKINVDYYTEKGYEKSVKEVFKNTPSMLTYFSNILKSEYPWEKYHQVVVRDFTAGAMENTSASVFYESLLLDQVTLQEKNFDAIIAHELFHQWFGDLITCESWANLSMNESMASYGEYLWHEHHYGKEYAEYLFYLDKLKYFRETDYKVEPIINFYYKDSEDLFDAHRYEKGAWVMHMLRIYLGDELFFDALTEYIKRHEFGTVEVHEMRLAFEKVSGEDLNWFFNQWFLTKGHPKLKVSHAYNHDSKLLTIEVNQLQDLNESTVFVFPIQISVYTRSGVKKETILVDASHKSKLIPMTEEPMAVIFNENNGVLCEVVDDKNLPELVNQLSYVNSTISRLEIIRSICNSKTDLAVKKLLEQLNNKHWFIRMYILDNMPLQEDDLKVKDLISKIALNDSDIRVRNAAYEYLNECGFDMYDLAKQIISKDSSYSLISKAIETIAESNLQEGLALLKDRKVTQNSPINTAAANLYSQSGREEHIDDFIKIIQNTWFRLLNPILDSFSEYLAITNKEAFIKGIAFLTEMYEHEKESGYRNKIKKAIFNLEDSLSEQGKEHEYKLKKEEIKKLKTQLGI